MSSKVQKQVDKCFITSKAASTRRQCQVGSRLLSFYSPCFEGNGWKGAVIWKFLCINEKTTKILIGAWLWILIGEIINVRFYCNMQQNWKSFGIYSRTKMKVWSKTKHFSDMKWPFIGFVRLCRFGHWQHLSCANYANFNLGKVTLIKGIIGKLQAQVDSVFIAQWHHVHTSRQIDIIEL